MKPEQIQELRHSLATPQVERTPEEIVRLIWLTSVMTDDLQQKLETLQPAPDPDPEPAPASKPAKTPRK